MVGVSFCGGVLCWGGVLWVVGDLWLLVGDFLVDDFGMVVWLASGVVAGFLVWYSGVGWWSGV